MVEVIDVDLGHRSFGIDDSAVSSYLDGKTTVVGRTVRFRGASAMSGKCTLLIFVASLLSTAAAQQTPQDIRFVFTADIMSRVENRRSDGSLPVDI
jgi:hypothetical protein